MISQETHSEALTGLAQLIGLPTKWACTTSLICIKTKFSIKKDAPK